MGLGHEGIVQLGTVLGLVSYRDHLDLGYNTLWVNNTETLLGCPLVSLGLQVGLGDIEFMTCGYSMNYLL